MHHLGKFKIGQTRPWPILVKFLMLYNTILSNKNLIPSPVLIKVDTTKVERDIESKLLSQRWNLIQGESTKKQLEFGVISYLLVK